MKSLKEEVKELARTVVPSSQICSGSPHRPHCQIPLYHNGAEEMLRKKILQGVDISTDAEDIEYVNKGILNWCIYCIASDPKLSKMFPWSTRKMNSVALKRYDLKYGCEDQC